MSCSNGEVTNIDDQSEINEHEAQSLSNTSKLEINDDNVAETTIEKDDSFQPTDKEIKYKTVELEMNVSKSKMSTNLNSDTITKTQQLNEPNGEELPIEKVDKTVSPTTSAKVSKICSIINTINNVNEVQESSSTAPETLIQDMRILNITEKNNKNINSSVVLNKHTESLRNLMLYDSNTDNESDNSDFEKDWQLHVLNNPDTGSSEDSESDSNESVESSDGSSIDIEKELNAKKKTVSTKLPEENNQQPKKQSALYSLEELDKFTLPELPDLTNLVIDYENEEFLHIGHVKAIVESLITIEANQGSPSYDLDTILFVDDQTSKKPLGAIYDVIGPVVAPIYCIRMKNEQEIQDKGIKLNMKVYSAPKSKYTQYVFLAELRKIKGTDASWLNDREMPDDVGDSSEDELESESAPPILKRKRDSLERHQRFEKTMNRCNSLHTRVARLMDHHRVSRRGMPYRHSPVITNVPNGPDMIPPFNPAVPPPNYIDLSIAPPLPIGTCPPHQPNQFEQPPSPGPHHPRFQRQQPLRFQNQSHSHNWNHRPGPSRGFGRH